MSRPQRFPSFWRAQAVVGAVVVAVAIAVLIPHAYSEDGMSGVVRALLVVAPIVAGVYFATLAVLRRMGFDRLIGVWRGLLERFGSGH